MTRISWIVTTTIAVATVLAGCSGNNDPKATNIHAVPSDGLCLRIPPEAGAEITDLPTVDCDQTHTHEIYDVIRSTFDTYPGFDALETEAQAVCFESFERYVGISALDSNLAYSWIVPTLASWEDTSIKYKPEGGGKEQVGDRDILCVVGPADGSDITGGTLRGSRR